MNIDGKDFEEKFKNDFIRTFPNGDIERMHDIQYGYKNINTTCDWICYNYPYIWYAECKAHKGASIPFDAIPQYERLIKKSGIKGVRAGVIVYLYEKEKVLYVPATTITKLLEDGKKSVGIKALKEGYRIIDIPSKKLRVWMDSDYSFFMDLNEGE